MSQLLADKVAVVTGGSAGLGLAIACALGIDGARVLIVSRSEERCRKAVARVEEKGGVAAAFPMDVTAPGAPARIVAEAVSRFSGLDVMVNNAAVFYWKKLFELTAEEWNQAVATNLTAPFLLTQEAAKVMIDQGRGGAVINITSIHGSVADANVVAQCATKFGLSGLTAATAEALREFEIRVNAVAPGSIEPNSADRRGSSLKNKVTQADIATLVAFLASDLARSVTGATIEAHGSTRTVIKA